MSNRPPSPARTHVGVVEADGRTVRVGGDVLALPRNTGPLRPGAMVNVTIRAGRIRRVSVVYDPPPSGRDAVA